MGKLTLPEIELMTSGHFGCPGCGACLAMRYVLKALGPNTIICVPACCWAVMPGAFPYTCIKVPMLYTAFETTAASASGVRAALDAKGMKNINVVGFAGDGGTLDIGIQALSGAAERGENIIFICYDNEAYMNTGIQRSSATPYGAWTTTTPVGKMDFWEQRPKKNAIEIMVSHKIPYAATATVSYPEDMIKKVQKAANITTGTRYIHILCPCPPGWRAPPEKTIELGKLAVECNIFPLYEVETGVYHVTKKTKHVKITEYFAIQGRFRHLPLKIVERIQHEIDRQWEVLLRKEKLTETTPLWL